jgi:integrase
MAQVWKATEFLGYPFGPYVRLLALTAQRRTEVASMRWDNLDLDAGTWTIPAADTKGERRQLVPLSPSAVEILRALPHLGVHVFTTDGRSHMTSYAKLKSRLDAFIVATGGTIAAWRLHDLRRSAATHMVRLGVREEIVSRVLNHAAEGVTARVYALHRYEPEKHHALCIWAEEIDRARAFSGVIKAGAMAAE